MERVRYEYREQKIQNHRTYVHLLKKNNNNMWVKKKKISSAQRSIKKMFDSVLSINQFDIDPLGNMPYFSPTIISVAIGIGR